MIVIPACFAVIPDYFAVIPDSIRDPVPREYWIADRVRNDKQVRNDKRGRNDKQGHAMTVTRDDEE